VSDEPRDDVQGGGPETGDGDHVSPARALSGVDLARAALAQARAQARARGTATRRPARRPQPRREPGEPELLGETLGRLLAERGWDTPAAIAGVTERWAEVAGREVAEHCRPEKFEQGVLVLVAESTAWATQIRLLVPALRKRLDEVVGAGVVSRVDVRGPTAPDWRRGPLRVRGPGPRDTYG
jgi:predicted nucleic acid-binding Zn ribbon protein